MKNRTFPRIALVVLALLITSGLMVSVSAEDKIKTEEYLEMIFGIVEDIQVKVGDVLAFLETSHDEVMDEISSEAEAIKAEVDDVQATADEIERFTKDELFAYVATADTQAEIMEQVGAVNDQVSYGLPLVQSRTDRSTGVALAGGVETVATSSVYNDTGRSGPALYHLVVRPGILEVGEGVSVSARWAYDDGIQATIPICAAANLDGPTAVPGDLLVCEFTADGYLIAAFTQGDSDFEFDVQYAATMTVP